MRNFACTCSHKDCQPASFSWPDRVPFQAHLEATIRDQTADKYPSAQQVQGLLNKMQEQFEQMAQSVVHEIDQLGARIDALEKPG